MGRWDVSLSQTFFKALSFFYCCSGPSLSISFCLHLSACLSTALSGNYNYIFLDMEQFALQEKLLGQSKLNHWKGELHASPFLFSVICVKILLVWLLEFGDSRHSSRCLSFLLQMITCTFYLPLVCGRINPICNAESRSQQKLIGSWARMVPA